MRTSKEANRFPGKVLDGFKNWEKPTALNTDKAWAYAVALCGRAAIAAIYPGIVGLYWTGAETASKAGRPA